MRIFVASLIAGWLLLVGSLSAHSLDCPPSYSELWYQRHPGMNPQTFERRYTGGDYWRERSGFYGDQRARWESRERRDYDRFGRNYRGRWRN